MRKAVLGVIVSGLCLSASSALACGSAMYERRSTLMVHRGKVGSPAEGGLGSQVSLPVALRTAQRDLRAGHAQQAYDAARPFLESPESTQARMASQVVGLAALQLGRPEEAVTSLEKVLAERPDSPFLQAKLGEAKLAVGQVAEAVRLLEPLSVSGLLSDADGYVALASALHQSGREEAAERALEKALGRTPEHPQAKALWVELTRTSLAAPSDETGLRQRTVRH